MGKLWDRQAGESAKAFEAFACYRDFKYENDENRSTAKVGQKLGKSKTAMDRLSSKYDWVKRALAYDDHMDQKNQSALHRQQLAARRRHAKISANMQIAAMQALDAKRGEIESGKIDFSSIVRMLKEGITIERLTLDMATDKFSLDDESGNLPKSVIILPRESDYGPEDEVKTDE